MKKIEEYLKTYDYIMNADVRESSGASLATANRILSIFVKKENEQVLKNGYWVYRLREVEIINSQRIKECTELSAGIRKNFKLSELPEIKMF